MDCEILNIEKKGYRFRIIPDQDAESSREWSNLGIMVCFHPRYDLGDKHSLNKDSFNTLEELKDFLIKEKKAICILPLFLLDHSGIWIKTSRFLEDSGGWDTSEIGFIYTTEAKIKEFLQVKKVTEKIKQKALNQLEEEVKTYNQYISGEVYSFILEKKKTCKCCKNVEYEHIDSCSGFYFEHREELIKHMFEHIDKKYKFLKEEALKES